jgi:hypothetical protein
MPEELRCLRRHDALCGGGGFCLFLGARERSGTGPALQFRGPLGKRQ